MKDTLAIILGGGKGTRLFPLTLIRSKPAVPLGGKYRLIDIPISNCINSDINKIFVLTQYNSASLNRHITQTYRFGLFSEGFVDILAAEQTPESALWYQGTADAVRQTLRHILSYSVKYVLILSGDQLYRMDYRKLFKYHRAQKADITVCVVPVAVEKASGFGILKLDSEGRITDFHEKPKDPALTSQLKVDVDTWRKAGVTEDRPLMASMGIYLFSLEAMTRVLEDDSKLDFGKDIIPAALSEYSVSGYIFSNYWEDIGTIKAFYEANLDLTGDNPAFTFYDAEAPIYTHPRFLPPSRIQNCQVEHSIVSEGCVIRHARIANSVVGIRSVICEESDIASTLIMGADFYESDHPSATPIGIGAHSLIRNAIIDKNARLGKGVQITNPKGIQDTDGDNFYIRDGIVIIPKNAIVPDGSVI